MLTRMAMAIMMMCCDNGDGDDRAGDADHDNEAHDEADSTRALLSVAAARVM